MSDQNCELFVSLVVSEMNVTEVSQHNTAIIQAGPSQTTVGVLMKGKPTWDQWCRMNQFGLRDPSTRSNKQIVATFRDKTNQDKSSNG